MPFQPIVNAVEAVLHFNDGANDLANVLHFQFTSAYTSTDLIALGGLIDGVVASNYLPLIYDSVAYVATTVRGLSVANDISATVTTSAGNGTAGVTGLPSNVSFCLTLRSGLTGRSARGRFFAMPTIIGNLTTPDVFSSTYANALVTMLQGIQTAAAAVPATLVIASRITAGAPRTSGVTFPVVSISHRNLLVDSQRGRLPRNH